MKTLFLFDVIQVPLRLFVRSLDKESGWFLTHHVLIHETYNRLRSLDGFLAVLI